MTVEKRSQVDHVTPFIAHPVLLAAAPALALPAVAPEMEPGVFCRPTDASGRDTCNTRHERVNIQDVNVNGATAVVTLSDRLFAIRHEK
jgi:hypothetical protein